MVPTLRVCKLRFLGALGRGARCSGVGLLLRSVRHALNPAWLACGCPGAPLQHYLHALRCPASPGQQRSAYHPVATVQPARVWVFWQVIGRCAQVSPADGRKPPSLTKYERSPACQNDPATPWRSGAAPGIARALVRGGPVWAAPQDNMKGASTRERRLRISFAAERALGCESAGRGRVQQRPSSSLQSGTRAARLPARSRLGAPGPVSGGARVVDAKGSVLGAGSLEGLGSALASAWRPSPWPASRPRRPRRAPWARSPSRTSRPSRPARATSSCRPRC